MSSASTSGAASSIGSAPAGCATTFSETFDIEIVNTTNSKADESLDASSSNLESSHARVRTIKRQSNALNITLVGGTMVDQDGRVGYVTTSGEFEFNRSPLPDQLYTGPFSVCANSSVALGSNAVWLECLDASSQFYNLYYFQPSNATCQPIYIQEILINSTSSTPTITSSVIIPSATSSSTSSVTSSAQSSATASPTSKPASHTGAIAGGVVGGVVGLALVSCIIAFFVIRRRKQRRLAANPPPDAADPTELEGKSAPAPIPELETKKTGAELHNSYISELHGSDVPELYSGNTR